mmetsp:Transcript_31814/g.60786  ORF Transcript_31814/g.60786 Transcript_31814/m.60786 type:complete len:312 (+) Transcript_31814:3378-4313(+)
MSTRFNKNKREQHQPLQQPPVASATCDGCCARCTAARTRVAADFGDGARSPTNNRNSGIANGSVYGNADSLAIVSYTGGGGNRSFAASFISISGALLSSWHALARASSWKKVGSSSPSRGTHLHATIKSTTAASPPRNRKRRWFCRAAAASTLVVHHWPVVSRAYQSLIRRMRADVARSLPFPSIRLHDSGWFRARFVRHPNWSIDAARRRRTGRMLCWYHQKISAACNQQFILHVPSQSACVLAVDIRVGTGEVTSDWLIVVFADGYLPPKPKQSQRDRHEFKLCQGKSRRRGDLVGHLTPPTQSIHSIW